MPDSLVAELRALLERVLANQADLSARLDRYESALPMRFRLAIPRERKYAGAAATRSSPIR